MRAACLPKRPRHYAGDIIALPTPDARRAALANVSEDWRDWVHELVNDHFKKRYYLRIYHHAQRQKNHDL